MEEPARKEAPNWNVADFDDSKWPAGRRGRQDGRGAVGRHCRRRREGQDHYACPLFRKEFKVKGEIRRATLYGSALGIYRFYINGQPVGNDYFTPDWTDYKKRVYYNTYDVTDLVKAERPERHRRRAWRRLVLRADRLVRPEHLRRQAAAVRPT